MWVAGPPPRFDIVADGIADRSGASLEIPVRIEERAPREPFMPSHVSNSSDLWNEDAIARRTLPKGLAPDMDRAVAGESESVEMA